MAKGKNDKGVFGPVSGRLPLSYGKQQNLHEMDTKRPAEESAQLAKEAPKHQPIATGEGPAGRDNSEHLKVKEGPFNSERGRAT